MASPIDLAAQRANDIHSLREQEVNTEAEIAATDIAADDLSAKDALDYASELTKTIPERTDSGLVSVTKTNRTAQRMRERLAEEMYSLRDYQADPYQTEDMSRGTLFAPLIKAAIYDSAFSEGIYPTVSAFVKQHESDKLGLGLTVPQFDGDPTQMILDDVHGILEAYDRTAGEAITFRNRLTELIDTRSGELYQDIANSSPVYNFIHEHMRPRRSRPWSTQQIDSNPSKRRRLQ